MMGRYPTTLAVELKLSQVTLEGLNKTLKLCTAAASKEFVNVLELQEKPPKGLDPEAVVVGGSGQKKWLDAPHGH